VHSSQGDNLLCAYILALTTLFAAKEEERLQAVFNPILGFMKFTCANGVDMNFISTQVQEVTISRTIWPSSFPDQK
jgi:hypothetical protein